MKRTLFSLIIFTLIPFAIFGQSKSSSDVYVNGYVRKDGTVVPGYYRSAPNHTNRDNFSTKGNTNPYTGSKGYIKADNKSSNYTYSNHSNSNKTYGVSNSSSNNTSLKKTTTNDDKSKFYNNVKNFNTNNIINGEYFYALGKRWIGLKKNIKYHNSDKNSVNGYVSDEFISINIGIKIDGGGLVMANSGHMGEYYRSKTYKLRGDLTFYLEDGDIIKCIDRKAYDKINKTDYTFYNLTRKEIHKLETNNISAIEYTVLFEDRFHDPKTLKYLSDYFKIGDSYNKTSNQSKYYISELFKPYWTKIEHK